MKRAVKVSISMAAADLALFKKRAKRVHGGNVSAVIAEMADTVRQFEAREELLAELEGVHGAAAASELEEVRAEWQAPRRRRAAH